MVPRAHGQKIRSLFRPGSLDHGVELLTVEPDTALRDVQKRLAAAERADQSPDAVCLIGRDADIPHVRFADQTGNDDHLLTDNPYGQTSPQKEADRFAGGIVDMLPVSRIPTVEPGEIKRLLLVGDQLDNSWQDGVAVTAQSWTLASHSVLEAIGAHRTVELQDVPPRTATQVGNSFSKLPGRVYFNVHGSDRTPDWFGDDGKGQTPRAMHASAVRVRTNAIAMSESCYGALILDPSAAMSMAFLHQGAGAFVGSTIIAWGPPRPPCSLADLIVQETYRALDRGVPLAAALQEARVHIAKSYLKRGEALPPPAHNSVASFVAYGAPLARVKGASQQSSPGQSKSIDAPTPDAMETKSSSPGVLDAIRQGMRDGSTGALGAARQRYRERLPPGAWKVFSSGRMTFGQLKDLVDEPELLQARLATLAGGPVNDAHVFQYASSKRFRACVTAQHGERRASILLDDAGEVVESWVSR